MNEKDYKEKLNTAKSLIAQLHVKVNDMDTQVGETIEVLEEAEEYSDTNDGFSEEELQERIGELMDVEADLSSIKATLDEEKEWLMKTIRTKTVGKTTA